MTPGLDSATKVLRRVRRANATIATATRSPRYDSPPHVSRIRFRAVARPPVSHAPATMAGEEGPGSRDPGADPKGRTALAPVLPRGHYQQGTGHKQDP